MKWFFLTLLFLIVGLYIFIQTPWGQNWIARQVTKRLSRDLQTKVTIKHVDFSLLNNMHLHDVLIEDRKGDTLLYAGDVKVRITDWFIFKKEAELKYIGLENAIIKFQRTDSVWQHQFILDYFSSPSTGKKKKKAGILFNLKKVEMTNVSFLKKDGWLGQDMFMRVGGMKLDADSLSLAGNTYDITSLVLKDPVVALHSYSKLKPVSDIISAVVVADHADEIRKAISWNSSQMSFKIGNLKIINGTFKSDKQLNREPLPYFDGQNILFTEINGELSNASFIGDTVYSRLKLTAKERSGLELKNLSADVKLTPQGMAFSNMDLVTNRSTLRNYFSMSYDDMSDMGDFIHKVKMAAVFDDSYVDSDDLAFFAPAMKTWKKKISLKGKVRGTVDDLVAREMIVKAGNSTILNGDISLTGLPDINQTFIDFKANDFRTTYSDAATFIPAIRRVTNPDLRKIQYVNFKGSFTGFIKDFVTFGTIQTNLGTITSDINMKLPVGKDPIYSGSIATDNFRLGEFIGNKKIGSVSLAGTVKGSGFNEKSRNTTIDGTIRFADYNNYRYENIAIKGKLDKKLFEGVASINDKNADLTLNGVIDFNGKTPRFDLVADVVNANLKNLKLIKDSVTFAGKLNINFTGDGIENFLGNARITDAEITKDGRRLPFDSLIVSSQYIDGVKTLTALSNEFEAKIDGDFNLAGLPDAFTFFLNKYYPAYVKAPKKYPANQNIKFNITTYNADEYLQLIDSSLKGFNNSHFEGNLNLANNELNFTAEVPQFKFRQYNFDQIKIIAKGTADSLVLTGETKNIYINDSLSIPQAVFRVKARNDSSQVSIVTGANQTVEKADINALVLTYNDGVKIDFDPSSFTINGKTWSIDENGELEFRSNNPAKGQLVLREGEQKIMLKTQQSPKGNWNDLQVELTKINLGDFAPFFLPKNRLEGLISGNILVEDPTNNLTITSDDIQTQYLRLDNDSLGAVKTSLAYDNKTKKLKIKGNTLNQENYLGFDANIFLGQNARDNIIALKARNFEIKILERFLGTLFTDMRGYLTGDINLSGEFQNLNIAGKGRLKDAGLKVIFTQCFYKIQDTDIELTPEKINLDGIVLTDTVTGNPIYISGGMEHQAFKNMFYNLDISTQKPNTTSDNNNKPVLLLNTTYKDNKQFYGRVKGTGSLTLAGPQSEMFMTINAIASDKDSSNITIPAATGRESGIADFLVERKYGREMDDSAFNKNATNIIYDVEVTATPMVTVKVVLDELTGDEIKGKGSGTLQLRSGTSEPLSLRGRFDIEEGDYLFTFQSFFKKPFVLKKGENNFIEWSGDPYDARINLTAVYTASNVSYGPLASSLQGLDQSQAISRARGDVYVVAKLTEKLFQPKFSFSLDFPPASVVNSEPSLAFGLQQLQKNENEMNKQATYLVVLGVFAPVESGTGFSLSEVATNSLSGIFFNVINEQVKKIVSNIFKTDKLNFNFSSSVYNRNVIGTGTGGFNLGSNVNASIGSSLFKNRIIVTVGGSVEGVLTGNTQQNVGFLKDFTIEILINQSGTFRANLFLRDNVDYLTSTTGAGRQNRTGLGLSYRKDVDHIGDLFRRKKNKKPSPPVEQKPEAIAPVAAAKEEEDPEKK
ncbi:MAG: translocation/assembly module TamB [Chitinophagaceae bacterium]|nr:translocation/assembly module TamB [Chitinophagaceae bacterium]